MLTYKIGNAQLIATAIEPSPVNPSMVVVKFSNGTEAGCTISPAKLSKYWNVLPDGQLSPKFCSADGRMLPTFTVKSINGGKPVILDADGSNKPLTY
jgi:hypothetical protein